MTYEIFNVQGEQPAKFTRAPPLVPAESGASTCPGRAGCAERAVERYIRLSPGGAGPALPAGIAGCQPDSAPGGRTTQGLESPPGLLASAEHLPLKSDSVDVFVVPHVLEMAAEAHQVLREIDRCLVAEGHVIILGFNPYSWWGLRRLLFGWRGHVPWSLKFYGLPRLKDWLSLLGFDTIESRYLFPHPPWQVGAGHAKETLLRRFHRDRWPLLAASYVLVARKRVATLTPIKPRWRPRRSVLAGGIAETRQGSLRPHG